MSSSQLHPDPTQATQETVGGRHERESRNTGERRRHGRSLRGRLAIAAVAVGVASGTAGFAMSAPHAPQSTGHGPSGAVSLAMPHGGATSASFARQVRVLEARGYVEAACQVHGDLMFNPRTHRYVTVRA